MDIILHVGAHRTGTTTLQRFLLRNRTELRQAGGAVRAPDQTRYGLFAGLMHRPQIAADCCCDRVPEGDGRWMPIDTDQQETLRAQYRADLAWLRAGADGIARLVDSQDALVRTHWSEAQSQDQRETTDRESGGNGWTAAAATHLRRDGGRQYGQQEIMV